MSSLIIELNRVSKRLGQQQVLQDMTLAVPEHSVFGFLGNNGAGKSTTIRLITGLLRADQGQIRVLGQDINQHKMAILRQIGCLVEAPSLYTNLNVREFLQIGQRIQGLPKTEIDRVLQVVNLAQVGKSLISHFSLGMKQRLALAHALLGQPRLLILDEPGNGLDPQGIQEIRQLLANLPAAANCSVFISSHQLDEVEKIASHIALLRGGSVLCQAPVAQLIATQVGKLRLEVGDAAHAGQVLQAHGYSTRLLDPQQLEVDAVLAHKADQLHHHLFSAGVRLFQSIYLKPSLEQWFLQTTRQHEHDTDAAVH